MGPGGPGSYALAALQQAQREVSDEARLLALQHVQGRHAEHVHLNLLIRLVSLCNQMRRSGGCRVGSDLLVGHVSLYKQAR